ncbi:MAG: LuxR C-terminal-related transcriptional regulator [Actinophytocola sp.]|uniref:LuxR C-terminal-related transcriptional regulator n=1 Tax=Actinophytocola sp. TaxID=1872138 RepID=UPI003D6C128C
MTGPVVHFVRFAAVSGSDAVGSGSLKWGRMRTTAIRIVVKARRRLVRDVLCAYLAGRPEFIVVGQTGRIEELAELCVLRRPDAALVDVVELNLPAVEALRRARLAAPATEIVVTYAEAAPSALEAAVRADITMLVPSSRGLHAVLRPLSERADPVDHLQPDARALTEYDMRIVSLMSCGHSVAEMAGLLGISPRTMENHKRRLYLKLNVGSSRHAVFRASALGLIDPPAGGPHRIVDRRERGRALLTVVHGQGPSTDGVLCRLLLARIPWVHNPIPESLEEEHWARWQRGPMVWVLVDPTHEAWAVPPIAGAYIVVVLARHPDLPTLVDMLSHGARAVVHLDHIDDLASVLSAVVRGYVAMDAAHLENMTGWMATRLSDGPTVPAALTTREADVLGSIACGHTVRQTARELGIAAKTVENTQSRLFRKLGVRNRAEALTVANRLGLLDAGRPPVPSPRPSRPPLVPQASGSS